MKEIDPKETKRASAYAAWMNAPMPMSTIFKTLDVSGIYKASRGPVYDFDILLSYCIGKAASQVTEFYMLPTETSMAAYEQVAIRTAVLNREGFVSSCDIPFSWELRQFIQDYMALSKLVFETAGPRYLTDESMVIGTVALPDVEIDGSVNGYDGRTFNPILTWGKPRKRRFSKKALLSITLQFHQAQMDGVHAAAFLQALGRETKNFKAT